MRQRRFERFAQERTLTSEAKKEIQSINRDDVKRAKAFKDMIKTEGWAYYQGLINTFIEQRMNAVLQPTSDSQQLASEHVKGAVYGLILARDAVQATVDAVQQIVDAGGEPEDEEQPQVSKPASPPPPPSPPSGDPKAVKSAGKETVQ